MNFLHVAGVSKREGRGFELQPISFDQPQFKQIAIAGETGSGKSTLLKIIAGWVSPDEGEVWFEDIRIKRIPEEKLIPGHPGIAYLSQHFELANFLTVEQVLSYANELSQQEAATVYEVCRISHLLDRRTDQLSGGEKQRIALARLLVMSPRLLLLDEPFSNLDVIHKNILKSVLHDVSDRLGITGILVSHDPQDTLSWANEIMVLRAGVVVQKDRPEIIYRQPANEYVAGLFGKYNLLPFSLPGQPAIPAGKKMLIRPEHVIITDKESGWPARVNNTLFYGSYYEMELTVANMSVTMRTDSLPARKGDEINVAISPSDIWYL